MFKKRNQPVMATALLALFCISGSLLGQSHPKAAMLNDGTVIALSETGDSFFLQRQDASHEPLWQAFIGANGSFQLSDLLITDDFAIVTGSFSGSLEMEGLQLEATAETNGFAAIFDLESGDLQWANHFGGTQPTTAHGLVVYQDRVHLIGSMAGQTFNMEILNGSGHGGDPMWAVQPVSGHRETSLLLEVRRPNIKPVLPLLTELSKNGAIPGLRVSETGPSTDKPTGTPPSSGSGTGSGSSGSSSGGGS